MKPTLFKLIDICHHHKIETSFIQELQQNGLIEIEVIESQAFINEEQLYQIERYANWHYELELNLQGIEIVQQLLTKIESLQQEILLLKNS